MQNSDKHVLVFRLSGAIMGITALNLSFGIETITVAIAVCIVRFKVNDTIHSS